MDESNTHSFSHRELDHAPDPTPEVDEITRFVHALRGTRVPDAAAEQELREFVEAITGVREGVWDPAKHPRGAFPQNRGWYSPTGGAGGVNNTFIPHKLPPKRDRGTSDDASGSTDGKLLNQRTPFVGRAQPVNPQAQAGSGETGHAPASPLKTVSLAAPDTPAIWKGAVIAAGALGLPSALLDWNQRNPAKILKGDRAKFKWGPFSGRTMILDETSITRLERVGKAGKFNATTDRNPFGPIYNEAFHAWFLGNKASLGWLLKTLDSQKQFGRDHVHKGEEAMSETINQIINDMESKQKVLTYDEVMALDPRAGARFNATPGHNEVGDDWHGDAGASKEMSEELYYSTVWVLFNGTKDPAPGGGDRLTAMKRFFASKFRPDWDEKKVRAFSTARYKK